MSLNQEIVDRLEAWIKKGITKEEKVILKENPRYGNTSLEVPEVNSEVEQGLGGKAKKENNISMTIKILLAQSSVKMLWPLMFSSPKSQILR